MSGDKGVRLKVPVRRGVSPHFFRGEGREVAEKGAGLTPAPSVSDTFNRTRDTVILSPWKSKVANRQAFSGLRNTGVGRNRSGVNAGSVVGAGLATPPLRLTLNPTSPVNITMSE
jgi:hypothetical protein